MITGGVAPILLKGADFRLRLYGNPVARPMCDLDLLISPEEVPQAQEVLEGARYKRAIDSQCFRPGFQKRFMGELHLTSPNGRLMVDLHWYLEAVGNFYRLIEPFATITAPVPQWCSGPLSRDPQNLIGTAVDAASPLSPHPPGPGERHPINVIRGIIRYFSQ